MLQEPTDKNYLNINQKMLVLELQYQWIIFPPAFMQFRGSSFLEAARSNNIHFTAALSVLDRKGQGQDSL